MAQSGLPFDDIRELVASLPAANLEAAEHTAQQLRGETGKLCEIARWYSAWSGRSPAIHKPLMTVFAGTHEVDLALEGEDRATAISSAAMAIASGEGLANGFCERGGLGLKFFDLALPLPVGDSRKGAALDEKTCAGTIGFGMEAIAGGTDLLCVSAIEPNIGPSALSVLALLGHARLPELPETPAREVVAAIRERHQDAAGDPLEVLRRAGGRETAALCGAILSARTQHIPVVLSGSTALAAAAVLRAIDPEAISHCLLAQPLHQASAASPQQAGLQTVFDGRVCEDEPSAGAIAAGMVAAAAQLAASLRAGG